MKKNSIIRFLTILSVVAVLFSFSAGLVNVSAAELNDSYVQVQSVPSKNYAKAEAIIDKANAEIKFEACKTKTVCELLVSVGFDGSDPVIQLLINNLVNKTNRIAEKAINKCKKLGVRVICEYEEIIIAGNVVLIDPLISIPL